MVFLSSCLDPLVHTGQYGIKNKTEIEIGDSNFKTLGSFSGSSIQTLNYRFDHPGLIAEARKDLWKNAKNAGINLNSSVCLYNVNVELINNKKLSTVTITADIVSFDNNDSLGNSSETKQSNYKENQNKKEVKQKDGFKNSLNKISDAFKKKEVNSKNTEINTGAEKPTFIACSKCDGTGNTTNTCTQDGCIKGKTTSTCTACNGNHSNGTDECFRCEGTGCDACDYDGKACGYCKNGKKTETHALCSGTGTLQSKCTKCAGTGKVKP